MDWQYSPIVKDHFMNPRNVLYEGVETFPCDGQGQTGNIKCGDQMLMLLRIENDIIRDVRWKTYGCASAIASTSMLSEMIKGMNIREAYNIKPDDLAARLGGLPDNKIHCSVLGDKALRSAIDNYLEQQGRKGELKIEANVICNCLSITDKDVETAFLNGARTWAELQAATKIGTACGACKSKAMEFMHGLEHLHG